MSVRIMSLVYNAHIGDPQQKAVLLALADRADDYGYCWPGLENLIFKTELGRSTVKRARKGLIDNGWIAARRRSAEGKNLTNVYRINTERLEKSQRKAPQDAESKELSEMFKEGVQSGPTTDGVGPERTQGWVQSDPTSGSRADPNTSVTPSVDTSLNTSSSEVASRTSDTTLSKSSEVAIYEQRDDVEQACTLLADLIEANGSKRPNISDKWRQSARLLIDKDGRSLDQVLAAIRWCQGDEFWRGNILSMPALRKQYDRLRLAAIRKRAESQPGARNGDLGTDAHLERYLERRAARENDELPTNLWDRMSLLGAMAGGAA